MRSAAMTPTTDDRLVLAHGFTQTAASWTLIQRLLATHGIASTAVDLPGHGAASHIEADLSRSADRLVRTGGPATYVGYSMGGRVALHAALTHPQSVRRLALIGATAGIDDDRDRRDRRAADERLARHIIDIGVGEFIDEWLATPLFAHLTPDQAQREIRMTNSEQGLASSLRLAGTGTQTPLWERLSDIEQPTLLLVGERDTKFTAIAQRMQAALPHARVQVIADAGHSVHLEQPEATVEALVGWLEDTAHRAG